MKKFPASCMHSYPYREEVNIVAAESKKKHWISLEISSLGMCAGLSTLCIHASLHV